MCYFGSRINRITLTASLLVVGRRHDLLEADALVELDAEYQADLEQDALQLSYADVVDRAGAEFAEELLGAEAAQILDDERPEVEHVVARHAVALLHHHDLGAQQLGLDRRAHAAGTTADYQYLLLRLVFFLGNVYRGAGIN